MHTSLSCIHSERCPSLYTGQVLDGIKIEVIKTKVHNLVESPQNYGPYDGFEKMLFFI